MSTPNQPADPVESAGSAAANLSQVTIATPVDHDGDEPQERNGKKVKLEGIGPTGRPIREIPEPPPLEKHGPAKIMAMCNQKGGVGKTTSTINLGASLAEYGRRVLLLDFDPQGALSVGLGLNPNSLDLTVYNLLLDASVTFDEVVQHCRIDGLDLMRSRRPSSSAGRPATPRPTSP